jgi:hypothetical protein
MQARRPGPSSRRAVPSAPAKKNNLPLILGLSAGGLLFLIVLIVVATSGTKPNRRPEAVVETKKAAPPPPPKPDVSGLEAEGKSKCAAGMDKVRPRLSPDPSAPRDRVWADLEEGLKLLNAGLAAFKKATELAGKSYEIAEFEKTRRQGLKLLCADLEKEAVAACEKGHKIILETQSLMDGRALGESDKAKLIAELESGKKLIETGMNLFDRSYQVSDNRFDTNKYGQALKMVRGKLLELKQ